MAGSAVDDGAASLGGGGRRLFESRKPINIVVFIIAEKIEGIFPEATTPKKDAPGFLWRNQENRSGLVRYRVRLISRQTAAAAFPSPRSRP